MKIFPQAAKVHKAKMHRKHLPPKLWQQLHQPATFSWKKKTTLIPSLRRTSRICKGLDCEPWPFKGIENVLLFVCLIFPAGGRSFEKIL